MARNILRGILGVFLLTAGFCFSDTHAHHRLEVGTGLGLSYIEEEATWVPSAHVHLVNKFLENFHWGVGFENIFDEHGHGVLSFIAGVRVSKISFNYMLGLYLYGGRGLTHHIEVNYIFEYKGMHIGPFLSVNMGEDIHYSAGMHVGFPF